MIPRLILAAALVMAASAAFGHDLYTDVHGKDGQWCCNGDVDGKTGDCAPALARATSTGVDFFVRGKEWVHIPTDRVTFLPIPGEDKVEHPSPPDGMVYGHFCGRPASDSDRAARPENVFGNFYFYCGFYPPAGY